MSDAKWLPGTPTEPGRYVYSNSQDGEWQLLTLDRVNGSMTSRGTNVEDWMGRWYGPIPKEMPRPPQIVRCEEVKTGRRGWVSRWDSGVATVDWDDSGERWPENLTRERFVREIRCLEVVFG